MKPTISVLLPNRNHGYCLPEAVEALLNQSYKPFEIIIVDNASTDDSVEVIKKLAKKHKEIKFFQNDINMGVPFSQNKALSQAKGDYIYLAAADDKTLPGFFKKSMNLLIQYPQAGLCCADSITVDKTRNKSTRYRLNLSNKPSYLPPQQLVKEISKKTSFHFNSPTCIIKRASFLEAGGLVNEIKWFSEGTPIKVVAFRYGACYIPEPLVEYRLNPNSYLQKGVKDWKEQKDVLEHFLLVLDFPKFKDVKKSLKIPAILAEYVSFGLTKIVLRKPKYWYYLPMITKIKLKRIFHEPKAVIDEFEGSVGKILPAKIKRPLKRIFG